MKWASLITDTPRDDQMTAFAVSILYTCRLKRHNLPLHKEFSPGAATGLEFWTWGIEMKWVPFQTQHNMDLKWICVQAVHLLEASTHPQQSNDNLAGVCCLNLQWMRTHSSQGSLYQCFPLLVVRKVPLHPSIFPESFLPQIMPSCFLLVALRNTSSHPFVYIGRPSSIFSFLD